ncbi:hypothetical protein D3C87_1569540 [compost metagenome]
MTKSMRMQRFQKPCAFSTLADHFIGCAGIQCFFTKDILIKGTFFLPSIQCRHGHRRDGDQTLFRALADHAQNLLLHLHLTPLQVAGFADTQASTIQ